jgi:Predicted membrane protein (DUF2053)
VDLADLAGLYLVLMKIPGKGHNKILTAAVGWGGAEMVLSHFYSLWFGARGAEFDWKYIQGCLDSNISLVNRFAKIIKFKHPPFNASCILWQELNLFLLQVIK